MPRRFRHVLLFAVAAIVIIGGSEKADAACVSSSGSQVIRPVFSDGSSVMYCPDGDNWSTLLSAGAGVPSGSTGHVQFNNAGVFGGDAGLFWDNTNKRLGIGTALPGARLDVSGDIRTTPGSSGDFIAHETDLTRQNQLRLGADALGSYINATWSTGGSGDLRFQTGNTERMRISTGGNVGIGTVTPEATLDVNGDFKLGAYQRLNFYRYSSGTSTGVRWLHLKTSQPINSIMQTVEFKGYDYGNNKTIDAQISYYPYPVGGVANINASGTHSLAAYKSSDGYAVISINAHDYYLGFILNQYGPGPQGLFPISITANTWSASSTGAF